MIDPAEYAHLGDPCQFCRTPQREVGIGPCPALCHGHVRPHPDGLRARCGGPVACAVCRWEWREVYGVEWAEDRRG